MALINCEECGKEVSDQASNCPSCGYPIKRSKGKGSGKANRKIKTIVIILAVCLVVGAVGIYFMRPNTSKVDGIYKGDLVTHTISNNMLSLTYISGSYIEFDIIKTSWPAKDVCRLSGVESSKKNDNIQLDIYMQEIGSFFKGDTAQIGKEVVEFKQDSSFYKNKLIFKPNGSVISQSYYKRSDFQLKDKEGTYSVINETIIVSYDDEQDTKEYRFIKSGIFAGAGSYKNGE